MIIKNKMKKNRIIATVIATFFITTVVISNFSIIVSAEQNNDISANELAGKNDIDSSTIEENELLLSQETPVASNSVTELDLGDYETQMELGTSQLLTITPLPLDATASKISYSSSDASVATVNSMGRITALKIGKTTIKICCDAITSEINLSVVAKSDNSIPVTAIEIANHEGKLKVDETMTLSATVLPADATNSTVTYKSSNEKIATVNSSGEVKGIGAGTVTIFITAGNITKEEIINVIVPTKTISMNNDYLVLKPGNTFQLSGTVSPAAAPQTLSYKSINTRVATVSETGVVTAVSVGNTSVIASNGEFQAAVSVIVNITGKSSATNDEDDGAGSVYALETSYDNIINASETSKLDKDTLKYLYKNKTSLLVIGEGYSLLIDGNSIVNFQNELKTDIKLTGDYKEGKTEGISFEINDGNPLCGNIVVSLDDVQGKYLYLYNESKSQYELIDASDLYCISISTPGKYLITDSKISSGNKIIIVISIVGGIALLIAGGVYIGVKKQYWFW